MANKQYHKSIAPDTLKKAIKMIQHQKIRVVDQVTISANSKLDQNSKRSELNRPIIATLLKYF
uniref:Uncharacterized protein n=1 Tax=Rhizophagus irregularis (strain DAOM 181602 / DAOM 197198 / MUCL 43194) TaxID=747089 RepID=U9U266_RHIID